tara:strand:+ start:10146 stop:10319 length:174 start_codon:yes stop_codon:yes gene_type:complete
MSRPKKESKALSEEKKRAASAVGMSEIHFMGKTKEACKWLQVPWGAKEHSTDTNQKE